MPDLNVLIFLHWSTALGFTLGNPEKLIHPTDSDGRICGFDDAVKDKPFLFFFDLTKCANPIVLTTGCPTPQVSAHVKCRQPFPQLSPTYRAPTLTEVKRIFSKTWPICSSGLRPEMPRRDFMVLFRTRAAGQSEEIDLQRERHGGCLECR